MLILLISKLIPKRNRDSIFLFLGNNRRGVAQLASASALGAGAHLPGKDLNKINFLGRSTVSVAAFFVFPRRLTGEKGALLCFERPFLMGRVGGEGVRRRPGFFCGIQRRANFFSTRSIANPTKQEGARERSSQNRVTRGRHKVSMAEQLLSKLVDVDDFFLGKQPKKLDLQHGWARELTRLSQWKNPETFRDR